MAWVSPTGGGQAPEIDSLKEFCRGRIAHFKIPRYLKVTGCFQ